MAKSLHLPCVAPVLTWQRDMGMGRRGDNKMAQWIIVFAPDLIPGTHMVDVVERGNQLQQLLSGGQRHVHAHVYPCSHIHTHKHACAHTQCKKNTHKEGRNKERKTDRKKERQKERKKEERET